MQRQYYVYIHRKLTDGTIFYVGKGFGKRCYSKSDRSLAWKNTVKKYGYRVEIICDNLQEWYVFELESELILKYGKKFNNTGTLVNYTDGGEGSSGHKHSSETIRKLKLIASNRDNSWKKKVSRLGSKQSEETKLKIKISSTGRKGTESSRLKQSLAHRDKNRYVLTHLDGTVFIGTRFDFNLRYRVNIKPLFKTNPSVMAHGWSLK